MNQNRDKSTSGKHAGRDSRGSRWGWGRRKAATTTAGLAGEAAPVASKSRSLLGWLRPRGGKTGPATAGRRRSFFWRTVAPLVLVTLALLSWLFLKKDGPTVAVAPVPAVKTVEAKLEAAARAPAQAAAAVKAEIKEAKAEIKEVVAEAKAALGVTSYYGATPSPPEMAAQFNPDYVPAAPVAVAEPVVEAAPALAAEVFAGVTQYFEPSAPVGEMPAVLNPDYVAAAQVEVAVAATAAAEPAAERSGAVTSYYEPGTSAGEMPAVINPDYVPAAPVEVAAAKSVPQPEAGPADAAPGTTSFFGETAPLPEAPARLNPDYKPREAAVAAVAPAALQSCQDDVTTAVKSGPIRFENAKATLAPESVGTLDRVAAAFNACPDARLQIDGHSDNKGAADMNQDLSERRAEAVVEYLTSKGVDGGLLRSAGYGMTRPVAPNDSPENMALNRRIEFTVGKK